MSFVRIAPALTLLVLVGPILAGLAGTFVPAFGYLPALGGHQFSLDPFRELASQPGIFQSALKALLVALVTTLISVLAVMLFVAGWTGTKPFVRIQNMISPLLAIPHAAAAFGLVFLIAPSGFFMRLVSPWLTGFERPPDVLIVNDEMGLTMIAGLVVKEIPFLFLVTLAALAQVKNADTSRLAASFGYGKTAGFVYAVWPQVYRQIRLAIYAVIAYASSVVDVAVILGPQLPGTLPVRLIEWMNDPDLMIRFLASAGAVLQLGVTTCALLCWYALEKIGHLLLCIARDKGWRVVHDRAIRIGAFTMMLLSGLLVFAGIAMLGIWSLSGLWQFPDLFPGAFTGRSWMRAMPRVVDPLLTTITAGLFSTTIALVLTIACLERETATGRGGGDRAILLIYLPLIVPQISFIFGLQILAVTLGFDAQFATLVFVHLIFVLPYVFLSLSDPWRSFDRRYEYIATGLGQSRLAVLARVRLPMMTRAILTAFAVGFAVSVGQYLPTILIGAGRLTTITTEAVALASGGNRRIIGVYAFLQTLLPFVVFAIAGLVPMVVFRSRRAMRV